SCCANESRRSLTLGFPHPTVTSISRRIEATTDRDNMTSPEILKGPNYSRNMGLFGADLPEGFRYEDDFITRDEEQALSVHIGRIEFSTFEMRGVVARRRVAFFGSAYDARSTPTPTLPDFLRPLRAKLGEWVGVEPDEFAMALINEYPPGAPI